MSYPLNNTENALAPDNIIFISNTTFAANQFAIQPIEFDGVLYAPTPSNGTVSNNAVMLINFAAETNAIVPVNNMIINETFSESGLPNGAIWSASYPLNSTENSTAPNDIIFSYNVPSNASIPTYQFAIQPVTFNGISYTPTRLNGAVQADNSITIYFVAFPEVTTVTTSTSTSTTTTIAVVTSGGGGGGSSGGGGGIGGGGGGSSKPIIIDTANGYVVNDVTQLNSFSVELCGKDLTGRKLHNTNRGGIDNKQFAIRTFYRRNGTT